MGGQARFQGMLITENIVNSILRGWKLAETNTDGSRATAGQRAYNFMSNGGGAITTRMVMMAMSVIISGMVAMMWDDLKAGQHEVVAVVTEQGKTIANNSAKIDMLQSGQQHLWTQLGKDESTIEDHTKKITRLEACQPICQPR